MSSYTELSWLQVVLAVALIGANIAVSVVLQLGLAQSLLVASLRTVFQLWLVGFVLQWVFDAPTIAVPILAAVGMTAIAGWTAAGRPEYAYRGMRREIMLAVAASAWLVTGYALLCVLPAGGADVVSRLSIPLLGMVLGNTLNGISLSVHTFHATVVERDDQIDMRLALGATRWEASRPAVQEALRAGMMPMINAMSVVGLVSIPGMMTGQLLAGTAPASAVKYQIVIMFLIASATVIGSAVAVGCSYRRLFSAAHRLRRDVLQRGFSEPASAPSSVADGRRSG